MFLFFASVSIKGYEELIVSLAKDRLDSAHVPCRDRFKSANIRFLIESVSIRSRVVMSKEKRVIFHLDMDHFFTAVEEREHPEIKGKPVIVGADPKGGKGRGVGTPCNYE